MRRRATPPIVPAVPHGERTPKLQLAVEVNRVLQRQCPTQAAAARKLGILQPHVSELAHYRLERFSVERLLQFLALLGQEVEIRIHAAAPRAQHVPTRRILVR